MRAPVSHDSNVVSAVQTSLQGNNLEGLHQFLSADSHLDLSTAWTQASRNNDSATAMSLCKSISQLLIKVDGERGFTSAGTAFIRRLLEEHAKSVFRNLSSLRPQYVNPTLRLLITMSQFDAGSLANEVYIAMDFNTFKTLPKLLTRSGPQTQKPSEEKVSLGKRKREDGTAKDATRGLFIALLFTLLSNAQPSTKAEILQRRPVMTEFLKHLQHDSETSVKKTLIALTRILESRDIPRVAKVQFFNDWTLNQMAALYGREDLGEDGTTLRSHVQKFFLKATTVPDQGICFSSDGLVSPANKKLYNPILAAFIMTLRPLTDDLQYDLLSSILTTTPELISHWLQNTTMDLNPRLDVEWIKAMGLIEHLLSIPLPADTAKKLTLIPEYVLTENILPTPLTKNLIKALQHESELVRLMTCRTFHKALEKLKLLSPNEDGVLDLRDALQRRVPLIEVFWPLSVSQVLSSSSEESVLLREQVILIIASYVELFDDLPSFDFAALFNLIMNASSAPRSDNEDEELEMSDAPQSLPISSEKEKVAVLSMAQNIDGLQWLTKKKSVRSILDAALHYICGLPESSESARRQAIEVLDHIIISDSFMFSTSLARHISPVPRIEAFVQPLLAVTDEKELAFFITFLEDCMIRFQASPYKYWDSYVELLGNVANDKACISLIVFVMKEQLAYVKDNSSVSDWLLQIVSNLIAIGEDRSTYNSLFAQEIQPSSSDDTISVWNATKIIQLSALNEASQHEYDVLHRNLESLVGRDLTEVKLYCVRQWLCSDGKETTILPKLKILSKYFCHNDLKSNSELKELLLKFLPRTSIEIPSLENLVGSQEAVELMLDLTAQAQSFGPNVLAALVDCTMDDTNGRLTGSLISQVHKKCDIRQTTVLSALGRALRRSAVEDFNLSDYLFQANDAISVDKQALANCIAAYLDRFASNEVPAVYIKWAEQEAFQNASVVLAQLLNSKSQEYVEMGLRQVESRLITFDDTKNCDSKLLDSVLTCVEQKAKLDKEFSPDLVKALLADEDDSTALLDVNKMKILTSLQIQTETLPSNIRTQLIEFHRKCISLLTRRFAEDRKEEDKSLSRNSLAFLEAAAHYLPNSTVAMDCGVVLLNPLVEAALENQLHHPSVGKFLLNLARSTDIEAFNYARAIQSVLVTGRLSDTPEVAINLLEFLHEMISKAPAKANIGVMDEVLKLYGWTCSIKDKLLFQILQKLEVSLKTSFGSRIKSWRLVESANDAEDVNSLDLTLSSDVALHTILNSQGSLGDWKAETGDEMALYDLRFVLPAIAGYLHFDSSIAMMKQLIEHHCLGLVLLGLCSTDELIRHQSNHLLSRFDRLITSSTIREKAQLATLMGLLHDSLSRADLQHAPIPLIQSVFLALSVDILMSPSHYLYEKLNRFLLARPQLDLNDIPLFLSLFASRDDYAKVVSWLLRLLSAGIRRPLSSSSSSSSSSCKTTTVKLQQDSMESGGQELDSVSRRECRAYERRHVLEMLMGLYRSKTATSKIKSGIEAVLQNVCESSLMRLYFARVGGRLWIRLALEEQETAVLRRLEQMVS